MAIVLDTFESQCRKWYRAGHRRHCQRAHVDVLRYLIEQHDGEIVARHVHQIGPVLEKAERRARLEASLKKAA